MQRSVSGYPNQFIKFETGFDHGTKKPCGVTVIGSNRWNEWDANNGGFVGLRMWNGAGDIDIVDVVGDVVNLTSSPYTSPDGWVVNTPDSRLSLYPRNVSAYRQSYIGAGDFRILDKTGKYYSLIDVLNTFNDNFRKGPSADRYSFYKGRF